MTIILNKCYGGFALPEEFVANYNYESIYDDIDRNDPDLVDFINAHGGSIKEGFAYLCAVDIPDDCTDWDIIDYDGAERVVYVLDGKIYYS